jgi:menaquinone-specific isochorismate synthase
MELQEAIERSRGKLTHHEMRRIQVAVAEECERELDQGHGDCLFLRRDLAEIVVDVLRHFDGQRYDLFAWCVMPNHVHAVMSIRPGASVDRILHSWKSYSSKELNHMLRKTGQRWQEDYFDRTIRNREELRRTIEYVLDNPAAARLADWPWAGQGAGSAHI